MRSLEAFNSSMSWSLVVQETTGECAALGVECAVEVCVLRSEIVMVEISGL